MLLHTDAFTHRRFYTQTLLHTDTFTHSDRTSFRAKGCAGPHLQIIIWHQFLALEPHSVRKSQFYLNFWWSNLISCERIRGTRGTTWNRNFTSIFADRTLFRPKGFAGQKGRLEIAILFQFLAFLAIEPHFVRKGSRDKGDDLRSQFFLPVFGDRTSFRAKGFAGQKGRFEIAILLQFLANLGDWTSYRAKGLHFVPSRWHPPRLQERNRKEEDVKMIRWEDVRMRRYEDEKMWE